MSVTLAQRTNHRGFPKAGELIEITGAHALGASDRAIVNLLYGYRRRVAKLSIGTTVWK